MLGRFADIASLSPGLHGLSNRKVSIVKTVSPKMSSPATDPIKSIAASQLRLGMYIHKLGGGWLSHSFWRGAFLLNRQEDLQAILASALPEVWIDLSRGLDVAQEHEARTAAMTETAATLSEPAGPAAAALRAPPPATPPSDEAGKRHTTSRTGSATFAEESVRARRICKEAREAVVAIFAQARMGRTVDADASLPLVEEIADSVSRNSDALVSMARLRARNDYTYMHSVAVCALMVALAQQLGLPDDEVREAGLAGLMHDLGKAMMPPDVLNKPGALTPAEFAIMREHPVEGWKLLRADGAAGSSVRTVALHHHEKFDGSGYPAQLSGEAIPLVARMGAILRRLRRHHHRPALQESMGSGACGATDERMGRALRPGAAAGFHQEPGNLPGGFTGAPGFRAARGGVRAEPRDAAQTGGQGLFFGQVRAAHDA